MAFRVALLSKIKRLRSTRPIKSRLAKRWKAAAANHPSLMQVVQLGRALPLTRIATFYRRRHEPAAQEKHWRQMLQYRPESWRENEPALFASDYFSEGRRQRGLVRLKENIVPSIKEQTRVLELLGRVNYRIIKGNRVYVEVDGVVYKTLYGGYWRSVFTGIEHYLLHCEQVSGAWAEDDLDSSAVNLPIAFSTEGWTASGHSLSFMVSQE